MRLKDSFYRRSTLTVARELIGKRLVRRIKVNGKSKLIKVTITETEAYIGEEDLACHARFGRTKRTEVMYSHGGVWYVYLIYGMYWMLNVITEQKDMPAAVLIRAGIAEDGTVLKGPGILTRYLKISKVFNGASAIKGDLYIEEGEKVSAKRIKRTPRIGIDYAGEYKDKLWRFVLTLNE